MVDEVEIEKEAQIKVKQNGVGGGYGCGEEGWGGDRDGGEGDLRYRREMMVKDIGCRANGCEG